MPQSIEGETARQSVRRRTTPANDVNPNLGRNTRRPGGVAKKMTHRGAGARRSTARTTGRFSTPTMTIRPHSPSPRNRMATNNPCAASRPWCSKNLDPTAQATSAFDARRPRDGSRSFKRQIPVCRALAPILLPLRDVFRIGSLVRCNAARWSVSPVSVRLGLSWGDPE